MRFLLSDAQHCLILTLVLAGGGNLSAGTPNPGRDDFFKNKVRLILSERCWDCHGADVQESGLRLDSRAGLDAGGDSGKKMVRAADPKSSYIIQVLRRQGPVKMPPDDPLSPAEIQVLVRWVQLGLPWPKQPGARDAALTRQAVRARQQAQHWSFQPLREPKLPQVQNEKWIAAPIDRFILAKLEANNIAPSDRADPYTLVRRLKFDLLGLPPTFEEVQHFAANPSPKAYRELVDSYLADQQYGERWGRHWLDVARYADTRGYAFGRERRYPYAYTYRDYVIDALNRDVPYDQFVIQQLAADLLGAKPGNSTLAALGFLTVGRKFNRRNLDIDDQIDVVGRGLLGLTVACARCHDHKYDPIPTDDYYALYGVFDSCKEPRELPVLGDPTKLPGYGPFKKELDRRQKALEQYQRAMRSKIIATARGHVTDYLVRAITHGDEKKLANLSFLTLRGEQLRPQLVQRWRTYLVKTAKPNHPLLGPLLRLALLPDGKYNSQAPAILSAIMQLPVGLEQGQVNSLLKSALATAPPKNKIELARVYGDLFSRIYTESQTAGRSGESNQNDTDPVHDAARAQVLAILSGPESPTSIDLKQVSSYLTRAENNKYRELRKKIDAWQVESPGAPPRAMVVRDVPQPHDARILIRGNMARPGKTVPRHMLQVITGPKSQPFTAGSGRLELARAIVAPNNPLTARVIVNRVWMHHFGQPIVSTPSDFGMQCDRPVHADLLDYLAARFITEGWSLKWLHRQIVLSSAYQQSSLRRSDTQKRDPENQLLWRASRQRLAFEPMWDALLAVAGRLDPAMGGRPVQLTKPPYPQRRAVYGFIDRQDLPNLYRVFDLGSPDSSCPRRARTTVPQQALFLMNSPFVVEQAKAATARESVQRETAPPDKLAAVYRVVLARNPTTEERHIGLAFIRDAEQQAPPSPLDAWTQFAQVLMMSNAFQFVD